MSKAVADPKVKNNFLAGICLFVVIIVVYIVASGIRHVYNPADKVVPTLYQIGSGLRATLTPNQSGEIIFLKDTIASLSRFVAGIVLSVFVSLLFGLSIGLFKTVEKYLLKPILFFGKIPPLALLPIIFVFAGLGEATKVLLIIIGICPAITLDIYFHIKQMSEEQFVKAKTLGANKASTIFKIVLPQLAPILINSIRVNIINVWVYLIAVESISASYGLGYRIFLVRRYLAMNIIIPYVIWIAILSFITDFALNRFSKKRFPWYYNS